MSEKLKTFIFDNDGDFIINICGIIKLVPKRDDGIYKLNVDGFPLCLTKNEIIKLFNLDLEVDDED